MNFRALTACSIVFLAIATTYAEETSRYVDSYPVATSKKGLTVENIDDALALGVKHTTLNVNLSQIVAPHVHTPSKGHAKWHYAGKDFYFNTAYVAHLDRQVRAFSNRGALVHAIILTYQSKHELINRLMLHPNYDKSTPNRLGAFNTVSEEGQQWFTAAMEFLAERWSRPDRKFGRVAGYIIGNEVNSHWWWSNMGRVTMEEFTKEYHQAVRMAHDAVRRQSSWARIYISMEHHWSMRYPAGDDLQSFSGKEFLDHFAQLARDDKRGDFGWNVAFHPYPENLFNPRFWDDKTALPEVSTPRITFKNLEVLTRYLQRDELLYQGVPRKVILSEQGFHAIDGSGADEVQAAAYCYAYKKVEANDAIDAFVFHRHIDHPDEGGLRLGLRSDHPTAGSPQPERMIYDCFRAADTDQWEAAFEFALPIVGLKQWP